MAVFSGFWGLSVVVLSGAGIAMTTGFVALVTVFWVCGRLLDMTGAGLSDVGLGVFCVLALDSVGDGSVSF